MSRKSCFSFSNRSIPPFPKEREQRCVKKEASLIDEISGLVIVKMLNKKAQSTLTLTMPSSDFVEIHDSPYYLINSR